MVIAKGRGRYASWVIVPRRDVIEPHSEDAARWIAREMLESGAEAPGLDEESLVDALRSGQLVLVRLDEPGRLLDSPEPRDLVELAPGMDGVPEPPRPDAWFGVEIVDQDGRPLPMFRLEVVDPTGATHKPKLDDRAATRLDGLRDDGSCVVTLRPQ